MDRKRVSRAGKELLANTIHSVTHQNRVLEEKSCWRSHSHDGYHKRGQRRGESPKVTRRRSHHSLVSQHVAPAAPADRWDHSGFRELYPDPRNSALTTNRSNRSPEPAESSGSSTSSPSSSSSSSSSDSSSSDSEDERRHRKRKKRSKHSCKKNKKRKGVE